MPRTRAELEKENTHLWQKLEAIFDELHELFQGGEDDNNEDQ